MVYNGMYSICLYCLYPKIEIIIGKTPHSACPHVFLDTRSNHQRQQQTWGILPVLPAKWEDGLKWLSINHVPSGNLLQFANLNMTI